VRYPELRSPSNIGTLAAKLAREAYFGEDVLIKCTVSSDQGLPGLPIVELQQLKQTLFAQYPEYWRSPHELEPLWSTATTSIGQLCTRLRNNPSNKIITPLNMPSTCYLLHSKRHSDFLYCFYGTQSSY
jgi:hypothetical protein